MYNVNDVVEKLKQSSQVVIFGAGWVSREVAYCLMEKPYQLRIDCFLVSDRKNNPESLSGIPVIDLEAAKHVLSEDVTIIVAVSEKYLDSVTDNLQKAGFSNWIPMTFENDLYADIREGFYREYRKTLNKPYLILEEELDKFNETAERTGETDGEESDSPKVRIYTAKCHVDRALQEDTSRYDWETPIQVGAALTDERICEVRDNTGDHISQKNRQYCELTALYWIWKNDRSDYVGLGHYRRHFELNREMIKKLAVSDIDVVLTVPIFNLPSVRAVYEHDHEIEDWEVMLEALQALAPEYRKTAEELQNGKFYYAYNMIIARKKILDDYCAWLFPILSYCEEGCGSKEDVYQNRYIGFLGEWLLAVYFTYHEEDYKIVHVRKHFIEK